MNPFSFLELWQRARRAAAFRRYVAQTWGISENHPMWWFVENVERIATKPHVLHVPPRYMGSMNIENYMRVWRRLHGVTPAK